MGCCNKVTIPEDNGTYASRKFVLSILSIILITLVSLVSVWFTGLQAVLSTFISGIIGVVSLYFASNVMNKHVVGKKMVELKKVNNQGE